jgi:hypothetical protein
MLGLDRERLRDLFDLRKHFGLRSGGDSTDDLVSVLVEAELTLAALLEDLRLDPSAALPRTIGLYEREVMELPVVFG